jgi:glycosyltransferase involved in cell wall biosynthesis
MKNELSIIVPVYNELNAIGPTIKDLCKIKVDNKNKVNIEIIIVDDCSNDGTYEQIKVLYKNKDYDFKLLLHKQNKGYGASIKTGVLYSKSPYFAITDADGTYPNLRILEFYNDLIKEDLEMIVGARIGENVSIPIIRKIPKFFLSKLANYLSEHNIPDLNSGFRIINKNVFKKYLNIIPNGFSLTTTITLALLTNNHSVNFKKIDYATRTGSSKIRPIADTLNFIQLILRTIIIFNPLKVFLPLSLILFFTGLVFLAFRMIYGFGFGTVSVIFILSSLNILTSGLVADLIIKHITK